MTLRAEIESLALINSLTNQGIIGILSVLHDLMQLHEMVSVFVFNHFTINRFHDRFDFNTDDIA